MIDPKTAGGGGNKAQRPTFVSLACVGCKRKKREKRIGTESTANGRRKESLLGGMQRSKKNDKNAA